MRAASRAEQTKRRRREVVGRRAAAREVSSDERCSCRPASRQIN
jgi:hypothetical protein